MTNFCKILILTIFIISCTNDKEVINIAKFRRYTHYPANGTANYENEFNIKYSFDFLNDTTILVKMYSFGDLDLKSIISLKGELSKDKFDTVDYQQYFLFLKGANTLKKYSYDLENNTFENEYFNYESQRIIKIEQDSLKVLSFTRDFDGIDGELRIYFNTKFGILALYSNSGFDASICQKTNDNNTDKNRIELIRKLVADTTFFPFPKEKVPPPPPLIP